MFSMTRGTCTSRAHVKRRFIKCTRLKIRRFCTLQFHASDNDRTAEWLLRRCVKSDRHYLFLFDAGLGKESLTRRAKKMGRSSPGHVHSQNSRASERGSLGLIHFLFIFRLTLTTRPLLFTRLTEEKRSTYSAPCLLEWSFDTTTPSGRLVPPGRTPSGTINFLRSFGHSTPVNATRCVLR